MAAGLGGLPRMREASVLFGVFVLFCFVFGLCPIGLVSGELMDSRVLVEEESHGQTGSRHRIMLFTSMGL